MSAVIKCDACGKVVDYTKARHVRVYDLIDATSYSPYNMRMCCDLCITCSNNLRKLVKGDDGNANKGPA